MRHHGTGHEIDTVDHLPEEQRRILAAIEPHEQGSLDLIADATGVLPSGVDAPLSELAYAGLVELHTEPGIIPLPISASLTPTGRALIRRELFPQAHSRLARVLGFPSGQGGGRR